VERPTDGSTPDGFSGAAFVVTNGDQQNPEVSHSANRTGQLFTSPFEAMGMALDWIIQEGTAEVTICSDSQALLRATECGSTSVASINCQLNSCTSQVVLQWISAHSAGQSVIPWQTWRQTQQHTIGMNLTNQCR